MTTIKLIAGFVILFLAYHIAEYFVLFDYNPILFIVIQIIFFLLAWWVGRWQGYKGLQAWGLGLQKGWFGQLLIGMLLGIILYGGCYFLNLWLGSERITHIPGFKEILPQLSLFCLGTLFSSFSEDVLTRGYIVKHLNNKIAPLLLIFISAMIYVLNHIYRFGDSWETHAYLFFLGILLCIPLLNTKRLWFTGGLHWMGNTTFHLTHTIIKTDSTGKGLSPNVMLLILILLMIPIVFFISRWINKSPISDSMI